MSDGPAESNGTHPRNDQGQVVPWSSDDAGRWPVSAVCCVAVLSVLALLLLLMNVLGLRLFGGDGHYDPDTGGSVAEWFGSIATLVALPAAVLFGVRQLQSSGDAILLGQRQLEADQAERAERRAIELATLRSALQVTVAGTNVVDAPDLATDAEATAVGAWRQEYHQRGWVVADAEAGTWQRAAVVRTNAEQLAAEPSPLLPSPWFVAVTCRNAGGVPLTVRRWTIVVDGAAITVESPTELAPGARVRRRLGLDVGLPVAFARRADAEAAAGRVMVLLDGSDTADRSVRIVHPPPE